MRMRYMCAFRESPVTVRIDLFYEYRRRLRRRRERERERRARESVHRRRLCDQESARLQRPPRKGRRRVRDRAIETWRHVFGTRRVAGESDEDREVRLQALRTKKVLDPGSVSLELVVSVLVTVVSFTLTCFSSHLIVTGTDPGRGDPIMSDCPRDSMVTVGMLSTSPRMWPPLFRVCPAFPLNWMSLLSGRRGPTRAIGTSVSDVQWWMHRALQWLVTHNLYNHSLANNLYQPRTSVKNYTLLLLTLL